MTEKNNFVYKHFLSFFGYFLCKNCKSFPHKGQRSLSPAKNEGRVKSSFFENLVGGTNPPPAERIEGSGVSRLSLQILFMLLSQFPLTF